MCALCHPIHIEIKYLESFFLRSEKKKYFIFLNKNNGFFNSKSLWNSKGKFHIMRCQGTRCIELNLSVSLCKNEFFATKDFFHNKMLWQLIWHLTLIYMMLKVLSIQNCASVVIISNRMYTYLNWIWNFKDEFEIKMEVCIYFILNISSCFTMSSITFKCFSFPVFYFVIFFIIHMNVKECLQQHASHLCIRTLLKWSDEYEYEAMYMMYIQYMNVSEKNIYEQFIFVLMGNISFCGRNNESERARDIEATCRCSIFNLRHLFFLCYDDDDIKIQFWRIFVFTIAHFAPSQMTFNTHYTLSVFFCLICKVFVLSHWA